MTRVVLWLALFGVLGASRLSQPGEPAPRPGQRAGEDRAAVQARLQRRLEETRKAEERIARALEQLEAGAPVEEVRGIAEGPWRGRRGPDGRPDGPPPDGPPPGRPPPGGPPPDGRPPEGPADRPALMAFLREHAPEIADRLEGMRSRNPEEFERVMSRMGARVREVMAERDPGLREARLDEFRHGPKVFEASRRLVDLIRAGAPEEQIDAARAQVRALLGEQFDLRLERHRAEIGALEERLTRIRREADEYRSRRDEIIAQGMDRIERRARETPGDPAGPRDGR